MKGNDRKRFCDQCNLHVHNLSAMSPRQIQTLALTPGRRCVAYLQTEDGNIRTRPRFESIRRPFIRSCRLMASLLALIFPFSFIGCAEKSTPPVETPQSQTIPSQDVPTPGGTMIRGEVGPDVSPTQKSTTKATSQTKPTVQQPPMMLGTPLPPESK